MTPNARFIDERITLKYGTGGGAMRALIEQVFAKGMGDVGEDGIGLAAMDDGAYRETGLTISLLASSLDYPEHHLRRLINGHLGFRNFSEFLNSYRITEARDRLSDPDRVRVPVLTTALDLGYGSLGPFNRAFKESAGMTPTEFRQLSLSNADSE